MAIELNDFIKDVLEAPCFGFGGTIDGSKQPVITRIFGFKYDDPLVNFTAYTFRNDARHVVNHLSIGSKMSATITNVKNFSTIQFNGSYKKHYDVTEDEMHYARDCNPYSNLNYSRASMRNSM